jgi:hypothetical protein
MRRVSGSHREESPRSNRAEELRDAGARPQRDQASGRARIRASRSPVPKADPEQGSATVVWDSNRANSKGGETNLVLAHWSTEPEACLRRSRSPSTRQGDRTALASDPLPPGIRRFPRGRSTPDANSSRLAPSVSVGRGDASASGTGEGRTRRLEFEKRLLFLATSLRGPLVKPTKFQQENSLRADRGREHGPDPEGNNRGHECQSKTRSASHKDTAATGAANRRLLRSS